MTATDAPAHPDLLLTGFAPFAGVEVNESWQAVQVAARILEGEHGLTVATLELPVEFGVAADRVIGAMHDLAPRLTIATGLAAGRTAVTPERVAINLQDARIPDNAGYSPIDVPCAPEGPAAYFSALPVKAMVAAAQAAGAPASVSHTAGTYVCNDVAYRLVHALATDPALAGRRAGFVHVPSDGELEVDRTGAALAEMALAALASDTDLSVSAGAVH